MSAVENQNDGGAQMSEDNDLLILRGRKYWKQERWSRDKKVSKRTTERHRALGLPWLLWGNEVYIPEDEGETYIAALVRRRCPPRRKAIATTTTEIESQRLLIIQRHRTRHPDEIAELVQLTRNRRSSLGTLRWHGYFFR